MVKLSIQCWVHCFYLSHGAVRVCLPSHGRITLAFHLGVALPLIFASLSWAKLSNRQSKTSLNTHLSYQDLKLQENCFSKRRDISYLYTQLIIILLLQQNFSHCQNEKFILKNYEKGKS
uniref:Uncharacterized protein n=1 Tax=Populus trichocarpa TaxID=3694 RepID=A0A2K2ACM8_POPTR